MIVKNRLKISLFFTMLFFICIDIKAIQSRSRETVKEYIEYAVKLTNYDDSTIIRQFGLMSYYGMHNNIDSINSMLDNRRIILNSQINDTIANIVQSMLLYYDSKNSNIIYFFINSPGGSVAAGLGIYDTMTFINSDIQTTCTGMAASMSLVILSAGTKGKRESVKDGKMMIHNPIGKSEYNCNEDAKREQTEIQKLG